MYELITVPKLPPKAGYVEDEVDGVRVYRNATTGVLLSDENKVDLPTAKANRIAESKADLKTYLEQNPLQWTDGKYYAVTEEKQSLLGSELLLYQGAVSAGKNYELDWNTTGDECSTWTFSDLLSLSLAISAFVKPLVKYQQAKEKEINACTTEDTLAAITIDYSSVNGGSPSASTT